MTESNNIDSLADHHIWSAIKNLPATGLNLGPWTGVTEAVSASDLDTCQWVERMRGANHKIWFLSVFEQRDVFCFIGFRLTKKHASRTVR